MSENKPHWTDAYSTTWLYTHAYQTLAHLCAATDDFELGNVPDSERKERQFHVMQLQNELDETTQALVTRVYRNE